MDLYQIIRDDVDAGKKLPDIFFCVGNNDFLIESVDRFEEYLNELKIDHRFDRVDGYEHEWSDDADKPKLVPHDAERAAPDTGCCKQPAVHRASTTAERRGEPLPGAPVTAQRVACSQGHVIRVEPWNA